MSKQLKLRLDQLVLEQYPHFTRAQVQAWIMRGYVTVNGRVVTKPGTSTASNAKLVLQVDTPRYVSRAGYKLEKALDHFSIAVAGKVALDAGISTGGFTHCLLQRDIARVYGIDVGVHLVHESVRTDQRLILLEKTNLRYLEQLPELMDLVTLDLSFISVHKVLDAVIRLMKPLSELIVLLKPQFEAGRREVERGGIISNPVIHARVIAELSQAITVRGFVIVGSVPSPILGGAGNQEFLLYARRGEFL